MFEKFKEEIKKAKQTVSSYQYKFSITTSKIMIVIEVIGLLPFAIYLFCVNNVWWMGFIPLVLLAILLLIERKVIKYLEDNYKEALKREEQQKLSEQEKSSKVDTDNN